MDVVYSAVFEARNEWFNIGLNAKIDPSELDSIKNRCNCNPEECLREMLHIYLKKTNPKPTWYLLIGALESDSVGHGQLADKLREKYKVMICDN